MAVRSIFSIPSEPLLNTTRFSQHSDTQPDTSQWFNNAMLWSIHSSGSRGGEEASRQSNGFATHSQWLWPPAKQRTAMRWGWVVCLYKNMTRDNAFHCIATLKYSFKHLTCLWSPLRKWIDIVFCSINYSYAVDGSFSYSQSRRFASWIQELSNVKYLKANIFLGKCATLSSELG